MSEYIEKLKEKMANETRPGWTDFYRKHLETCSRIQNQVCVNDNERQLMRLAYDYCRLNKIDLGIPYS